MKYHANEHNFWTIEKCAKSVVHWGTVVETVRLFRFLVSVSTFRVQKIKVSSMLQVWGLSPSEDKHVLIPHAKDQFSERNRLRNIAVDRPNKKHTSYFLAEVLFRPALFAWQLLVRCGSHILNGNNVRIEKEMARATYGWQFDFVSRIFQTLGFPTHSQWPDDQILTPPKLAFLSAIAQNMITFSEQKREIQPTVHSASFPGFKFIDLDISPWNKLCTCECRKINFCECSIFVHDARSTTRELSRFAKTNATWQSQNLF